MNYNEVTFRIFPRKKEQFGGKERISEECCLAYISEESPSLSCIYYIQGWLSTVAACNVFFLESLTFREKNRNIYIYILNKENTVN